MAKLKWEQVESKLVLVEGWARDGLTDEQIAKNLGISKDTFYQYKKRYSDFSDSLKRGKEIVDYEVENALLKNALNGNITAQIYWLNNRKPKRWKNKRNEEENNTIANLGENLSTEMIIKLKTITKKRFIKTLQRLPGLRRCFPAVKPPKNPCAKLHGLLTDLSYR